jgi:hypothetical protein
MARAGVGRIVADRVPPKTPAAPTKTKAQIEADERARAAAASKAAADRAEAARQTKAQVERAERAEAERVAWIIKNGPRSADAMDAWLKAPAFKPSPATPPSSSPSRPSSPSQPAAPGVDTGAQDRAAQEARERAAREAAEREAARREAERLEALRRAEEERIAAIVAARPTVPKYLASTSVQPVKYASPADILIQESSLPVDLILKQTLEKIGGLELISLVRHDTVNGQDIVYQPVKNLSQIEVLYNSQNIVKIPDSSEIYFKNFAIKLEAHIPPPDDSETMSIDMFSKENNVYLNPTNGKLVLELLNLKPDYEVEIQTVSLGKVFDDTIYDEDES